MNIQKTHIISLIGFSPKYEFESDERKLIESSIHYWRNPKGELIGVWKEDSMHHRGLFFLECYPNAIWEVWRPDVRADKVYTHSFENGLVHKSFPVIYSSMWNGLRKTKGIYSPLMVDHLHEYITNKSNDLLILVLPVSPLPVIQKIQEKFSKLLPILHVRFINNESLLGKFVFRINPMRCLHENIKALQMRRLMKNVKHLVVTHKRHSEQIDRKYNCQVFLIPHFEDINFWKPDITKEEAREMLTIPKDVLVFFSSSRLVHEYQLDKVIDVLFATANRSFRFYISGYGAKDHVSILNEKIEKYGFAENIVFTGYISGNKLKEYYLATDVYISTCIRQACPKSTNKALLLEVPCVVTDTGFGAELLQELKCGLIITSEFNKSQWIKIFQDVFSGIKINVPNRERITSVFEKNTIGEKWMMIFETLIQQQN
jgi:glycosyltransferase involved in cell wall biosynthesis